MVMADTDQTANGGMPDFGDLRASPRFTLLLRTAKLLYPGGEYMCIVRDVSATGVRLRLFHPLPYSTGLSLELANGSIHALEKVWERDDHAGFRFADSVDVQSFLEEPSRWPKRGLRLRLDLPITLFADGIATPAVLRNLSQQGAGIRVDRFLALAQKVRIDARGLPLLTGTVCWRANPEYGLALEQRFAFDELAKLAYAVQPRPVIRPHPGTAARLA